MRSYLVWLCTKALKNNLIFIKKFSIIFSIVNIRLMYLSEKSNLKLFIANPKINYYSLKRGLRITAVHYHC